MQLWGGILYWSVHCSTSTGTSTITSISFNIGQCVLKNIHKEVEGACYKYEEISLYVDGKTAHSPNIPIIFNVIIGNSARPCSAH
jgi:hypothetical protein